MIGAIFHIENRDDDFNQLPSRAEMSCHATYYNWLGAILAGVGGHTQTPNQPLEAMRRREARIAELNAPQKPSTIREIADEVIDVARDLVSKVVPTPLRARAEAATSALDTASAWLLDKLQNGPVAATVLERMADDDKIARRTLERARRKLGLTPRRINRRSFWMLPERESAKD